MHNVSEWKSCTILKMQFIDLLLVRWIFGGKFGHKNYEDFEHPTCKGKSMNSQHAMRLYFCPYGRLHLLEKKKRLLSD